MYMLLVYLYTHIALVAPRAPRAGGPPGPAGRGLGFPHLEGSFTFPSSVTPLVHYVCTFIDII